MSSGGFPRLGPPRSGSSSPPTLLADLYLDGEARERQGVGPENLAPADNEPGRESLALVQAHTSAPSSHNFAEAKQQYFASGHKLNQREIDLRRRERLVRESAESMEAMRIDLDKWEGKLTSWKEALLRKARDLDRRKDAVNQYIEQREQRANEMLTKLSTERDRLREDKDSIRKARVNAEEKFQEQSSLLKYRRKDLAEREARLNDQLKAFKADQEKIAEKEEELQALQDRLGPLEDELKAREADVKAAGLDNVKFEKELDERRVRLEKLDAELKRREGEAERVLAEAQALQKSVAEERVELEESGRQLDELAEELQGKEAALVDREAEVKKKEEELVQSLEEASEDLAESEKENSRKAQQLEARERDLAQQSRRVRQWEAEVRQSSERVTSMQKDLELREKHLARYLSSFDGGV